MYETKQGNQIQEIEDKLGYAAILNNIAVLYRRMEKYDKSADLARKVIDIYRMCARSNSEISLTELTKACRNYSLILRRQGQYEVAVADDVEHLVRERCCLLGTCSIYIFIFIIGNYHRQHLQICRFADMCRFAGFAGMQSIKY